MADAYRDSNSVPTIIAGLNTDGTTIVRVEANATSNSLMVSDGVTGSDHGPANALRDNNDVPVWIAASSSDGKTPVVLYADNTGKLLIQST